MLYYSLNNLSFFLFFEYCTNSAFPVLLLYVGLLFSVLLVMVPFHNTVYSVIIFILIIMFSATFIYLLTGHLFLSFALVLVYVGAISILLIFSLMLLQERANILFHKTKIYDINIFLCFIFFYYFLSIIYFLNTDSFVTFDIALISLHNYKEYFYDYFYTSWNDISILGLYLFGHRFIEILILTFILISGMISSISIVISKSFIPKIQNSGFQLIKSSKHALRFIEKKNV